MADSSYVIIDAQTQETREIRLIDNGDGTYSISVATDASISPTTIGTGRKTVAAADTAEALGSSTPIRSVTITAESNNTGVIVIGGSSVVADQATRQGTPLAPGESITVEIDNLNKIYLDSTVDGDGVTYTYLA